jgi:hypothetical protein
MPIHERQTHLLDREDVTRGLQPQGFNRKKKSLLMILKGYYYGTQQSICLPPHLMTKTDPVSETLFSSF